MAAVKNAQMKIGFKTIGVNSQSFFPHPYLQIDVALLETSLKVEIRNVAIRIYLQYSGTGLGGFLIIPIILKIGIGLHQQGIDIGRMDFNGPAQVPLRESAHFAFTLLHL